MKMGRRVLSSTDRKCIGCGRIHDGRWKRCEKCLSVRRSANKAYRLRHPSRVREAFRRWDSLNRDHINNKSREWRKRTGRQKVYDARRLSPERKLNMAEAQRRFAQTENGRLSNRLDQRKHRMSRRIDAFHWAEVVRLDPCSHCGESGGTIDHVVPVSAGGAHSPDNLVGACVRCNSSKNNRPLLLWMVEKQVVQRLLNEDGEACLVADRP
jgi:5-methylcytosine-specific restriction endonuclease McrA